MSRSKSVQKSFRVSRRREKENLKTLGKFKLVLRKLEKAKEKDKLISQVFGAIDKAARKGVLHKNKAARLKARLSHRFKFVPAKKTLPKRKN